jgi:hypothetical protein
VLGLVVDETVIKALVGPLGRRLVRETAAGPNVGELALGTDVGLVGVIVSEAVLGSVVGLLVGTDVGKFEPVVGPNIWLGNTGAIGWVYSTTKRSRGHRGDTGRACRGRCRRCRTFRNCIYFRPSIFVKIGRTSECPPAENGGSDKRRPVQPRHGPGRPVPKEFLGKQRTVPP